MSGVLQGKLVAGGLCCEILGWLDVKGRLASVRKDGESVGWVYEHDAFGRRVRAERGGVEHQYLYGAGDSLLAEKVGSEWVYYGYGGAMYQRVSSSETVYQHWSYRGDLVSQSSAGGVMTPAPITDAFGDVVSGVREVYELTFIRTTYGLGREGNTYGNGAFALDFALSEPAGDLHRQLLHI